MFCWEHGNSNIHWGQAEVVNGWRWYKAVVPQWSFGDRFYQIQLVQMSQSVNQKYVSKHVFPLCHFYLTLFWKHSVQFSHVWLFVRPHGLQHARLPPVHHQLPELAQRVGDAIQPSHPLSSPSPAFSLSQNQGLFMKRLGFLCYLWMSKYFSTICWKRLSSSIELLLKLCQKLVR